MSAQLQHLEDHGFWNPGSAAQQGTPLRRLHVDRIDALAQRARELRQVIPPQGVDSAFSLVRRMVVEAAESSLEQEYVRLARSSASDLERLRRRSFWCRRGGETAPWLIRRLRSETDVETLDAVADLLSEIGPNASGPLLAELDARPEMSSDQARVLLTALRWIRPPAADEPRQAVSILTFANHPDPDIRASAVRATRSIQGRLARAVLREFANVEQDADVRGVIDRELEVRQR